MSHGSLVPIPDLLAQGQSLSQSMVALYHSLDSGGKTLALLRSSFVFAFHSSFE